MAKPEDLAMLTVIGQKNVRWAVLLRGYLKAEKGGAYSPPKARAIAEYLIKLADEADARNGVELEGTSGVPYGEDKGTTEATGQRSGHAGSTCRGGRDCIRSCSGHVPGVNDG